ncbi:hypothetical protein V2J09_018722 [Rumex salicifolius]
MDQTRILLFFFLLLLLKSTLQQQQPLSSFIERRALLQLRSSLGLRSRDWPIKVDPCLNWRGISCVNGTVVGINVSGFRRTRIGGQNPQFAVNSLANLTRLESFIASNFALPGQIPDLFGNSVGNLRVLDLSFCSVKGVIPSSLGKLTQLGTLNLSHNVISETIPSSLGQLLNLSVLDLSWNNLSGSVPNSFASLGNLTVFDISRNFLSGSIPPIIGTLSNLQKLNFSRNNLTGSVPAQLGDLSSLVDLDLSANSLVSSLPTDLNGMKNLQRMLVRKNTLSGEVPDDLFGRLTKLRYLDLSLNNFSGAIPDTLWSLSSLTFVDASGNNFTGTLPITSATVRAPDAQFNLSSNMYYGELTSVVDRFSFIDLSSNYFQGQVSAYAKSNGSVNLNCLQNVTGQRTLEDCTSFYASKGIPFDNFGQPSNGAPGPALEPMAAKKSQKRTIILAAVFGALGLLLILLLLGFLYIRTRKREVNTQRGIEIGPIPTQTSPPPRVALNFASLGDAFTYQLLLQATGEFSDANLIKHGHSGDLFKGLLEDGNRVIVKRVDLATVRREAYVHELDFCSKVKYTRLVPLLGHCLEKENEKYLVYKYMPNGDLSSSLYRKVNGDDDGLQSLDWITRLKIATGAAESLCYLHHECSPPFVHRDVQASSILLDDKFEVRLGSLSEICAQEGDAHQSKITRFLRKPQNSEQGGSSGTQTSTWAYDVYCFGKVLLELVTGKMGISASNEASVKEWLDQTMQYIHIYDKELIHKIKDPSLMVDEDLLEEVWAMAIVARSCLNPVPSKRPLMKYILKALENPLRVVREENNTGSARLRSASSSRNSWNPGAFGSWRQSNSDVGPPGSALRAEGGGSQGSSGPHNDGSLGSAKKHSREIFPEPQLLYIVILFLLAFLFSAFVLILLCFRRFYCAKQRNRVLLKQSSGITPLVSKYIDGEKRIEEVGILVSDGSGFGSGSRSGFGSASSAASAVSVEVQNIGWGRWYALKELEAATRGFSDENVVGEGGYGVVYRGFLEDRSVVAVKNLRNNKGQAEKEFEVEVEAIGRVRHKNLVGLMGYCAEGPKRMLVYEYIENGNLEQWLHGEVGDVSPLTWDIRMKIAIGTAKGYVSPEYASTGMLSEGSDVYSFGVLLMELITGRSPVDYSRPHAEMNLVDWFKGMIGNRQGEDMLDPRIQAQPSPRALKRALLVCLRCVDKDVYKRPKMGQIVHMLEADEFPFRSEPRPPNVMGAPPLPKGDLAENVQRPIKCGRANLAALSWLARSKPRVGLCGLWAKARPKLPLEWRAPREAGFTEQRSPPALGSGRITSRRNTGPYYPVGLAHQTTTFFGPN